MPATFGVAMEVPLRLAYPDELQSAQTPFGTEERMLTPGAESP